MSNYFGAGNFLYVCLAALTELHLSTAPCYVPHVEQEGDDPKMPLKYRGRYLVDKKTAVTQMHSSSDLWIALREEVDEQRTALRWISRFSRKHFDHKNQNLQADFDDIMERFTLRVQDLEQSESQFRDYLAVEGTRNSILMAEMSIRESKRVMLCMSSSARDLIIPLTLLSDCFGIRIPTVLSCFVSIWNGIATLLFAATAQFVFLLTIPIECARDQQQWSSHQSFHNYRSCNVCIFCSCVGHRCCISISLSLCTTQTRLA